MHLDPPKDGCRTAGLCYTAHCLGKVRILLAKSLFMSKQTDNRHTTLIETPILKMDFLSFRGTICGAKKGSKHEEGEQSGHGLNHCVFKFFQCKIKLSLTMTCNQFIS